MTVYQAMCPNLECGKKVDWQSNQEVRSAMAANGSSVDGHMTHDTFHCPDCGSEGCNHKDCEDYWGKSLAEN